MFLTIFKAFKRSLLNFTLDVRLYHKKSLILNITYMQGFILKSLLNCISLGAGAGDLWGTCGSPMERFIGSLSVLPVSSGGAGKDRASSPSYRLQFVPSESAGERVF